MITSFNATKMGQRALSEAPAVENQADADAKLNAEKLPTRINLSLSSRAAAKLLLLRQKTDASTNAEVLRNAFRLYDALIEEAEKGNEFLIRRYAPAERLTLLIAREPIRPTLTDEHPL